MYIYIDIHNMYIQICIETNTCIYIHIYIHLLMTIYLSHTHTGFAPYRDLTVTHIYMYIYTLVNSRHSRH